MTFNKSPIFFQTFSSEWFIAQWVSSILKQDLDKAIKELDGKTIDGTDKGPKFKI